VGVNKLRILINNDNGRRDLLGLRLLEICLRNHGFDTAICNRVNMRVKLRSYRPHALIAARGDNPVVREAAALCKVFILPGEGGRQTKETMLSVFMGRGYSKLSSVDWITRCFLWNKNTKDWLLETGLFDDKQLLVVGNPRLDIYRRIGRTRKSTTVRGANFRIGVAVSATSTSCYYGAPHYAQNYFDHVHKDMTFPIVAEGRHFEDIVWRDHAILRHTIHFIKRYLSDGTGDIWLRPNPLEAIGEYKFLERRYPERLRVMADQPLPDFLRNIDCLVTCWSTTGLEALLLGIPTISISGLIDEEHLYRHISAKASGFDSFVPFYHMPRSEEELFKIIETARCGLLEAAAKPKCDVADLLYQNYNWPSSVSASELIAQNLLAELNSDLEPSPAQWRKGIPLKFKMPVFLASVGIFVRSYFHAIISGEFKSYRSFLKTYDPQIEKIIKSTA
jgi:surface carbohydrate biosynthesis protein